MIAMITRLASHKGIDIVRSAFNEIMKKGVQFVVLGTGEPDHENFFRHMQNVYGNRVRAIISFNKDLAQKIYAGADIFLMPSKSEPCGLSQMMAMRYGTVPIVRATGGLKDSVIDCGDGQIGQRILLQRLRRGRPSLRRGPRGGTLPRLLGYFQRAAPPRHEVRFQLGKKRQRIRRIL